MPVVFTFSLIFSTRLTPLELAVVKGGSVSPSVCLSVTLVSYAYAVQTTEIHMSTLIPNFIFLNLGVHTTEFVKEMYFPVKSKNLTSNMQ